MSRFGVLVGRNAGTKTPRGPWSIFRNRRRPVWPLVVNQERMERKELNSRLELEQSLVNHIRANTVSALEISLRVLSRRILELT